ncbi:MAG: hypothetical protein A3F43_02950 [Gammaproteobacteria bacterium RIFCSPHIGHO2_12_FULL_42_10]|nr:MAG: hypothetical protein A3F43_02950 [Gammaproteobacteria bacterium RIFCSPHIGHO2_12_FULL_42_10]
MRQLDSNDYARYAKQISLSEIGAAGQLKLKNAKVLCIGAGGLGTPLLQYLTAAGVGRIGIIDHDVVELSNLQRQIIYRHNDIGKFKVTAAKNNLQDLNPSICFDIYAEKFASHHVRSIIAEYDIVADCTDHLANRYLVNEVCVELDKPFVFAGITRYHGQCMFFHGKSGPCFNCMFPENLAVAILPDCNAAGVLGVLPGILGTMQANMILQYILQLQRHGTGQLFTLDILDFALQRYQVTQDPECQICIYGRRTCNDEAITPEQLNRKLHLHENFLLLDVRSPAEHAVGHLGGKLIPLPELSQRLDELNPELPVIIYCHSGQRSQAAVKILQQHQFKSVAYLQGGLASCQHVCAIIRP